jgi:phospholipid/cholesterol/gamma-HCH transport system permease protein
VKDGDAASTVGSQPEPILGAMVRSLGRVTLAGCAYLADLWTLVFLSLRELAAFRRYGRAEVVRVTARQVLFTGVDALPVLGAIALMVGIIIMTQAGTQISKVGSAGLIGSIIVVVVIRELGPLLTVFLVIGRSGAAITTELGNMRVSHEITALELMGIRVLHFIVAPRVVGLVVSIICLILYFDAVAVLGGFLAAKAKMTVSFGAFAQAVARSLSLTDVLVTVAKGMLFGTAVAGICCHHGLSVRSSPTEVPQQTTQAIINSITVCLLLDIVVMLLAYL